VYRLPSANHAGTGWLCIWDAGGSDTLSAAGSKTAAEIDLRSATLRDGKGTAGFVSAVHHVSGGFTIAHGVVIENATGSSKADHITGNSHANVLDGGAGADRMDGLGGNDTYYIDDPGDRVADTGGGHDAVLARTSYILLDTSGVEILQAANLDGRSALKLTGNASANTITGNAGSNVLDGGAGRDTLTGGPGRDQFAFTTEPGKGNRDLIADFSVADDTIRLDRTVFKALQKGGLPARAFWVASSGHGAHDASDRIVYDETAGALSYDPDGTGRMKAVVFAMLESGLALTAHDFFVI
jgi:serralysin